MAWLSFVSKIWAKPGLFFVFIFVIFSLYPITTQIQFQFQQYKLKKRRWCVWDSNPGPQKNLTGSIVKQILMAPCIEC